MLVYILALAQIRPAKCGTERTTARILPHISELSGAVGEDEAQAMKYFISELEII